MKFKEKEYSEIYARVGRMATSMPLAILNRVARAVYDQHVGKTSVHCIYFSEEACCQKAPKGKGCFPGTTVCEAHPSEPCATK